MRTIDLALVHSQGLNFLAPARNPLLNIVVGVLTHILEIKITSLSKGSKHRKLQPLRRLAARSNYRLLSGDGLGLVLSDYPDKSVYRFFWFQNWEARHHV